MENYEWAKEMNCAVTVCDAEGIIIYQNDKAVETYKKHGNLIGKNLYYFVPNIIQRVHLQHLKQHLFIIHLTI